MVTVSNLAQTQCKTAESFGSTMGREAPGFALRPELPALASDLGWDFSPPGLYNCWFRRLPVRHSPPLAWLGSFWGFFCGRTIKNS
jgi:hypothetical protein